MLDDVQSAKLPSPRSPHRVLASTDSNDANQASTRNTSRPRRPKKSGNNSPSGGGSVEGRKPRLPNGEYELGYIDYSTVFIFKAPKVVVRFKVLTMGEHFGETVERWYRVTRLSGRPRKSGNFTAPFSGDCYREFCRLFPERRRNDRISYASLANKIVIGRVRMTGTDRRQRKLPEQATYSVVDELLRIGQ